MSNKEILEKAIQKAIDGGWNLKGYELIGLTADARKVMYEEDGPHIEPDRVYEDVISLIFNHDFARALWGEPKTMGYAELKDKGFSGSLEAGKFTDTKQPGWQYHLQNMVIAEDPIKYLGEHLDG